MEAKKHIVGFSGGIDSQACARWVLNRFPPEDVILLNSDVGGHEHPITTQFIEDYSRDVHPVTVVTPLIGDLGRRCLKGEAGDRRKRYAEDDVLTFDRMAEIKGMFPSRKFQFCTEHLKLQPAARWIRENITAKGLGFVRYSGVRRQEGAKNGSWRATASIEGWDDYFACPLFMPIADWTKQMAFDYVRGHGESVNPLYSMGFDRVGCAPCINSNKADILEWATRFPEMIDKVRAWEDRTGFPFFRMPAKDGRVRFVDEIVEWSKTLHGGKQYSLLVLQSPAACDSNFGLCE